MAESVSVVVADDSVLLRDGVVRLLEESLDRSAPARRK